MKCISVDKKGESVCEGKMSWIRDTLFTDSEQGAIYKCSTCGIETAVRGEGRAKEGETPVDQGM